MGVGGGGGGVLSRLYEIMSYYKIPQETETDALINSLGTKKEEALLAVLDTVHSHKHWNSHLTVALCHKLLA